jgi:hypothetical protein
MIPVNMKHIQQQNNMVVCGLVVYVMLLVTSMVDPTRELTRIY